MKRKEIGKRLISREFCSQKVIIQLLHKELREGRMAD